MVRKISRLQQFRAGAQALLDEKALPPPETSTRWHRFVHFWVLVARSFSRNRCPVRASALAYASLLALIPMLAVAMSIASGLLKKEGEAGIEKFIVKLVDSVTPPAPTLGTNLTSDATSEDGLADTNQPAAVPSLGGRSSPPTSGSGPGVDAALARDQRTATAQHAAARKINEFIQNTRSGAIGVTGSILLIFAAISMLSRIEATFNDIWGVARGRTWFMRIVLYWAVLTLTPLLLVAALGLATGPHLDTTKRLVSSLPFIGSFLVHFGLQLLPVLLLCLTFGAFYMLMPNTKVHWKAALVGGFVSGLLFHLNNMVSVLYVSRVVSNSKVYGSLALVPVFMIGLYFCWVILLFGAQVAYAFQNRATYLEERQIENINQRGREFVALRLITCVAQRYLGGESPPSVPEMAEQLAVPSRLIQQILQTLVAARLVVETAGSETAYLPARPMENINCHDVLLAMRAGQGQDLATREEPARAEVYGEFQRIQEAERQAAASVTMLALAHRAQPQLHPAGSGALQGSST